MKNRGLRSIVLVGGSLFIAGALPADDTELASREDVINGLMWCSGAFMPLLSRHK